MSAYVVERNHIRYLIVAAIARPQEVQTHGH